MQRFTQHPNLSSCVPLEHLTWSLLLFHFLLALTLLGLGRSVSGVSLEHGSPECLLQQPCSVWAARPAGPFSQASRQGGAEARRPGRSWLSSLTYAHSEVKLSVVTYLTNSIVDEILQELYHSHKSLVRPNSSRLPPPPDACRQATILRSCSHLSSPGSAPDPAKDAVRSTRRAKPRTGSVLSRPRPEPRP